MSENIFSRGKHTEAFGTAIVEVVPQYLRKVPRIDGFCYTAAGTAHVATVMRPVGETVTSDASSAGLTTLTLESIQPGKTTAGVDEELAAADWVAWRDEDGCYHAGSIASISGQVITLDVALASDVKAGAKVWGLYEVGRSVHRQYDMPISTRVEIPGPIQAGWDEQDGAKSGRRTGAGDVLVLHIDNVTAAGQLEWLNGGYVPSDNDAIVAG